MLLTIHDMNLKPVSSIDNDKTETLNFFDDRWTRFLETGSSTFDFTVFKKAITSDNHSKKSYNYLNEKSFISFVYEGETHLFTVRKTIENEKVIKCQCVNLNLELINEYANPYKAANAMSFKDYCEAMDLLNFTLLTIGVNEVSDKKIVAEWEGSDTKLARLLSLANKFGAELEFKTYLNNDSSIKRFVVNVYHENDDSYRGVGKLHPKPLRHGKDFTTLSRTVDKTDIYNMVRPTGMTEDGRVVTIAGLASWAVTNEKGEREFYQEGEGIYAPLSMQMYPSAWTSGTTHDQWIRKDMTVESDNPETIRTTAYRNLKKYAYPAVTYEVEGFINLGIGDTVYIEDDGFSPTLLLEMRVSEQVVSFTNPKENKTTFSNARALENRLSSGIQARLDQLIEDAKPYTIKMATDNGVAFKNGQGQSVVTPTLMKGNKTINSGWRWSINGEIKSTNQYYVVKAKDIAQTIVLTIAAWVDNKEVASEQITFINATDGVNGAKGDKGDKGEKGDLTAVHIGGRNLLRGTKEMTIGSGAWSTGTFRKSSSGTIENVEVTDSPIPSITKGIKITSGSTSGEVGIAQDNLYLEKGWITLTYYVKGTAGETVQLQPFWRQGNSSGRNTLVLDGTWQKVSFTAENKVAGMHSIGYIYLWNRTVGNSVTVIAGMEEYSNVPSFWREAPEDITTAIEAKADQALTQEQLNALNEKSGILQAELEAKASVETVNQWLKAYQNFVKANGEARSQAERELTAASQRVAKLENNLNDMSERWNFIDSYMSSSNEGLVIGKNDGSSSILFSPNGRISMFSAGAEVMYISQGVIHIENGIFSKTIQIGRFREEQYHLNLDMNVIRYVGGV